ncbi:hypothetical protein FPV67DRAFT_1777888 [Lyophyllum atratum]|nr:hypothetical protein FPV67DRAFT_1777888 [Lyophyllum atratum]
MNHPSISSHSRTGYRIDNLSVPAVASAVAPAEDNHQVPFHDENFQVRNQAFADYVDANLHLTHVNNQDDIVPIVPSKKALAEAESDGIEYGFLIYCPGQDNTNSQCTIGYVPIFSPETQETISGLSEV